MRRSAIANHGLERNARLMELLARTALSDQHAFAELYRATSAHLYAVALRILREAPAAEEALQESFINVWHHAQSYLAAKSQPMTWLTSIVRNRCLDKWSSLWPRAEASAVGASVGRPGDYRDGLRLAL